MAGRLALLITFVLAALAHLAFAADGDLAPIPALTTRVTDTTHTLTAQQISSITSSLAALEQRKGSQIAVLMVATTSPETIEQYATRVYDQWKLGRKGVDDGVLIVALTGPSSTSSSQMFAMNRPSDVPPVHESSGAIPVAARTASETTSTSLPRGVR